MSKSSSRFSAAALVTFFGLVTVLTTYGFASKDWLPVVASEHGVLVDGVIAYLLITTGVIFVIGHGVLICFVWRYSVPDEDSSGEGSSDGSTSRPAYKPVSRKTEWKWALIPVLVMAVVSEVGVLFLGIPVFKDVYGETPADAVQAEVVAYQFGWFVRYPGADGKFGRTDPKLVHRTDNPVGLVEEDPELAAAAIGVVSRSEAEGRLGDALAALTEALASAREVGELEAEVQLLEARTRVALASGSAPELQRGLYELGRASPEVVPGLQRLELLLRGAIAANEGDHGGALELVRSIDPFDDPRTERWRQAVRARACSMVRV